MESTYIAAMESCDAATATATTTQETYTTAQVATADATTALADAVAESARLTSHCNCRVQHEQAEAWTAASAEVTGHAALWKQANEVLCALGQNGGADNCQYDACPTFTQPTTAAGVADEDCANWSPPTDAPVVVEETPPPEPPIAALPMNDVCTFTPVKETMPFSVASGVTSLITQIKAGYREVYVMLDATADIDLVLEAAGSQTVIVAYDFHNVHHGRNWGSASITSDGMSIRSCTDSCHSSVVTAPYSDGSTYTVSATSSNSNEFIYIAEVTETLNLYVDGHQAGSGTVSYGFDCAADCATCNAI